MYIYLLSSKYAIYDGQSVRDLLNYRDTLQLNTAIHVATERGHITTIAKLIKGKAKADLKNQDMQTPLHYAAKFGRLNVIVGISTRRNT